MMVILQKKFHRLSFSNLTCITFHLAYGSILSALDTAAPHPSAA